MSVFSLILGLAGALCGLIGIFTGFGALPPFIEAEEGIGPIAATTGFMWGLALLLLISSIAISLSSNGTGGSPFD